MGRERLRALRARHAVLEARLQIELARPLPDSSAIRSIKQAKLALKDELTQWEIGRQMSA